MSEQKRYLIGGNWKANGTVAQAEGIVQTLNEGGDFPKEAEVVIAPPAHLLGIVRDTVRKDVGACLRGFLLAGVVVVGWWLVYCLLLSGLSLSP